jgi:hypothetical protein
MNRERYRARVVLAPLSLELLVSSGIRTARDAATVDPGETLRAE